MCAEAEHGVPFGPKYKWGRMNGFDHYAIFRYFDALSDYTFNGSEQGKHIALGSGSKEQRFMGLWNDGTPVKEAIAGDNPVINKPSKEYAFNWDHFWNPLIKGTGSNSIPLVIRVYLSAEALKRAAPRRTGRITNPQAKSSRKNGLCNFTVTTLLHKQVRN